MNALDLGHEMRKLDKAGKKRHTYKLTGVETGKKDTVMTLEIAGENQKAVAQQGSSNEFTENAHMRQVLCLLPSEAAAAESKA